MEKFVHILLGCLLLVFSVVVFPPGDALAERVALKDEITGRTVGKVSLYEQRVVVKLSKLTPMTEFSVMVKGGFAGGSIVLGHFQTGPSGSARFIKETPNLDLSLLEEVHILRYEGDIGILVLKGEVK